MLLFLGELGPQCLNNAIDDAYSNLDSVLHQKVYPLLD